MEKKSASHYDDSVASITYLICAVGTMDYSMGIRRRYSEVRLTKLVYSADNRIGAPVNPDMVIIACTPNYKSSRYLPIQTTKKTPI